MHTLDWLIVCAYMAYVVYDGAKRSRATHQLRGYFLANRSLPWWAVGLSIMATQMSAITLVGTTGQAYVDGMGFIQFYFGLPLAMIILSVTVVPFFYRAKIYTAYEFLEKRFDPRTRILTSLFFLISRGLSCGVIIAAPAVILSIVLGWNLQITVLAIGLPTVIYTIIGGVQAVTWTDVKQMVLIFVGMTAVVIVILSQFPDEIDLSGALSIAGVAGRLNTVDFTFDLNETYTFWSGLIGGLFLMLSYFGCDQSQVQRYLTAKSVSEGRISLLMSAFLKIPIQFAILLVGVLVFIFYHFTTPPLLFNPVTAEQMAPVPQFQKINQEYQDASRELEKFSIQYGQLQTASTRSSYEEALRQREIIRSEALDLVKTTTGDSTYTDVNYVFPSFVINYLPIGIVGLMIAAIFAAAMSSISAELNALATASVMDFYKRHFKKNATEAHYLKFSRLATAFWGITACGVAIYATQLGSLIEVVNRFGSYFYGSLLGVFVLALATKWARAAGAFWGLLAGMVTVGVVSATTDISFLWYNVVGVVAVFVVGTIISLAPRVRKMSHR